MPPSARTEPGRGGESGGGSQSDLRDRGDIVLARRGNQGAQARLIERHQDMIYHLCLRLLGRREDAADATQEVFLRALGALGTFDSDRSFRGWLASIAWNLVRDLGRRARLRTARPLSALGVEPAARQEEVGHALEARERRELVLEALATLPESARAVLVLRDLEGLAYEEIAESFQCSLGTIKSRIHRARLDLKAVLERHRGLFPDE